MEKKRIVSGMRPTGPLHLGHYFGVLKNWINFQEEYECYFFVADWHALTSEYSEPQKIRNFIYELVKDWFSVGLNPEKCIIFLQSQVKQHAELHLLLSMLTPLGWLERNPTYKEVKQELIAKDLNTYGFLGYPVLMASDILVYRPQLVPVGEDQLPHLELTREIARRFNYLYGETFPEPQAKLTEAARLPGLDGRKMSKSYGNSIYLNEDIKSIEKKIRAMLTDTNRKRKNDPGNPNICNLFPYHKLMTPAEVQEEIITNCTQAKWGCVDCKKILLNNLIKFLEPIHDKRKIIDKDSQLVDSILEKGNKLARESAEETMKIVRSKINFI
ncbi:MAG: tryptophanyl-tRNA synthetase [Desulfonauticus sp.]|jgi:tryptophanyl-tRNA synthetase|nr:MAG: Tryptophan--tRNA ligase [Desulfonauticus sp. 38_4375]MDK2921981.1 tryptophanyl-tRNA synthetase [Desulfonauticus sp.]